METIDCIKSRRSRRLFLDREISKEIINKMINIICDPKAKAKIIIAIEKAGGNIINLHTSDPSLEQVFMRYTE